MFYFLFKFNNFTHKVSILLSLIFDFSVYFAFKLQYMCDIFFLYHTAENICCLFYAYKVTTSSVFS